MLVKAMCFILILAILNVVKEGWRLYTSLKEEKKYESDWLRTFWTFASIAFIITVIIFGL